MEKLYLRDANAEDCDLLFDWVNDNDVRANSFETDKIDYNAHCRWYKKALDDINCKQFILMYTFPDGNNIEVGQARITIYNTNKAEIHYSIAKQYRTMGFGQALIGLVCDKIRKDYPQIRTLTAKVKPDNVASKKSLIDNGFIEKYSVFEINI